MKDFLEEHGKGILWIVIVIIVIGILIFNLEEVKSGTENLISNLSQSENIEEHNGIDKGMKAEMLPTGFIKINSESETDVFEISITYQEGGKEKATPYEPYNENINPLLGLNIDMDSKVFATVKDVGTQTKFKTNIIEWNAESLIRLNNIENKIEYVLNGGVFDGEINETYKYEDGADLAIPTRKGYSFGGWYEDEDFSGLEVYSIPELSLGDKKFYAKWNIEAYNISYETNGGNLENLETTYNVETSVTLPIPNREGYVFSGWYADSNFGGSPISKISLGTAGDKKYYAKWTLKEYICTINYKSSTGTFLGLASFQSSGEKTITPNDYPGYTTPEVKTVKFDSDKTVDFVYTPIKYQITYELNGGKTDSIKTEYTVEDTYVLPIPEKEGYNFVGWKANGQEVDKIDEGETGNKTFNAIWDAKEYTIIYDLGYKVTEKTNDKSIPIRVLLGKSQDKSIIKEKYNVQLSLPDLERFGYTFKGWQSVVNKNAYKGKDKYIVDYKDANEEGAIVFKAIWEPISEFSIALDIGQVVSTAWISTKTTSLSEYLNGNEHLSLKDGKIVSDIKISYNESLLDYFAKNGLTNIPELSDSRIASTPAVWVTPGKKTIVEGENKFVIGDLLDNKAERTLKAYETYLKENPIIIEAVWPSDYNTIYGVREGTIWDFFYKFDKKQEEKILLDTFYNGKDVYASLPKGSQLIMTVPKSSEETIEYWTFIASNGTILIPELTGETLSHREYTLDIPDCDIVLKYVRT